MYTKNVKEFAVISIIVVLLLLVSNFSFAQVEKQQYERLQELRCKSIDEMSADEYDEYATLKSSGVDRLYESVMPKSLSKASGTGIDFCRGAVSFCTDESAFFDYPAGTNGLNATEIHSGTDVGCLGTTPSPAWFVMKISTGGPLLIYMQHSNAGDIDFICWGPFEASSREELLASKCVGALNLNDAGNHRPSGGNHSESLGGYPTGNVVDCSYDPASTEWCYIPNAQPGQWYIFLITNYGQRSGNITFEALTRSDASWLPYTTATTDCNIVAEIEPANPVICEGQTLSISCGAVSGATSYKWFFNGANQHVTGTLLGSGRELNRPNATPAMTGWYELQITRGVQTSSFYVYCVVNPIPIINSITPTPASVCEGQNINLSVNATNAASYAWSNGAGSGASVNIIGTRSVSTYRVTATNNGCTASSTVAVTVNQQPTVSVSPTSARICPGSGVSLISSAFGEGLTYSWSTGATTQNLDVTPATTTTYTLTVQNPATHCSATAQSEISIIAEVSGCNVIYVSKTGRGTGLVPSDPTDIFSAMEMCQCAEAIIKMEEGTYDINQPLHLVSGVTIEGGYFDNFTKKTSRAGATTINRTATNVEGTAAAPRLVAIEGNGVSDFRLQDVTVRTANAPTTAILPSGNEEEHIEFDYDFEVLNRTYTEIIGTAVSATYTDDDSYSVSLPFDFTYDQEYAQGSNLYVSTNGTICFGSAYSTRQALPSSTYAVILPLCEDYNPSLGGIISYSTTGVEGSRVLTIQWKDIPNYSENSITSYNFQVKLYEGTNTIELCYGNITPYSATHYVGLYLSNITNSEIVKVTGNWQTPEIVNVNAGCTMTSVNKPASGLVYRFIQTRFETIYPMCPPVDYTPLTSCNAGISTYGLHLANCSNYNITRCEISAGNASAGKTGPTGETGAKGASGGDGTVGLSTSGKDAPGSNLYLAFRTGGTSTCGGGKGGQGGYYNRGTVYHGVTGAAVGGVVGGTG